MRQKKPQIVLYNAWGLVFKVLPNEKAGQLVKAIFAHVNGEYVPPIDGLESVMNEMFSTIDEDMAQYEKKCLQMKENINKRYSKEIQTNNNCNTSEYISEGNNNNKNKNNKQEQEHIYNSSTKTHSRFVPPTLDEIRSYITEKNYSVDAESFYNFYESKGWFVGKNKMTKWKAAIANWQRKEQKTVDPIMETIMNFGGDDIGE